MQIVNSLLVNSYSYLVISHGFIVSYKPMAEINSTVSKTNKLKLRTFTLSGAEVIKLKPINEKTNN